MDNLQPNETPNVENPSVETPQAEANNSNTSATPEANTPKVGDVIALPKKEEKVVEKAPEETPEEQQAKLVTYQEEVTKLEELAKTGEDIKGIRKNIVDLKEKILALFVVNKSDKDSLITRLQEAFDVLKGRQDELKAKQDEEFDANFAIIEPKVQEAIAKSKESTEIRAGKDVLIAAQNELKAIMLKKDKKDELFALIQTAFTDLNEKLSAERESYEMECSENYLIIKPRVELVIASSHTAERFKDARQSLIDLQGELKDLKLKKEKRDELYSAIRKAFDDLNERQDKDRAQFNEENKSAYTSGKTTVEEALEFAKSGASPKDIREKFIAAQKLLKDLTLLKSQRDELYGAIRVVFEGINNNLEQDKAEFEAENNENYQRLSLKLNEAMDSIEFSNDFREIREGLIAINDEIKIIRLKRESRNELFARMRKAFEAFDEKRNSFSEQRKVDKKEKLKNVLSNLESRLTKMTEMIAADNQALEKQKSKLDSDDAMNANIHDNIANIEARLKERTDIVADINKRIADVNKELNQSEKA